MGALTVHLCGVIQDDEKRKNEKRTDNDFMCSDQHGRFILWRATSLKLRQCCRASVSPKRQGVADEHSLSPHALTTTSTSSSPASPTSISKCWSVRSSILSAAARLESVSSCEASSDVGWVNSLVTHLQPVPRIRKSLRTHLS